MKLDTLHQDTNGTAGVAVRLHIHGPFDGFDLRMENHGKYLTVEQECELVMEAHDRMFAMFPGLTYHRANTTREWCLDFLQRTKGKGVLWFKPPQPAS